MVNNMQCNAENHNIVAIIPIFKDFEVLPQSHNRMLGYSSYISYSYGMLKGMNCVRRILLYTDMPDIMELISNKDADVIVCDYKELSIEKMINDGFGVIASNLSDTLCENYIYIHNPNLLFTGARDVLEEIAYAKRANKNVFQSNDSLLGKSLTIIDLGLEVFAKKIANIVIILCADDLNGCQINQLNVEKIDEINNVGLAENLHLGRVITNKEEWILADRLLRKKKIIFRCDGYRKLGMGHIYNCITLAYSLYEHEILVVTRDSSVQGIEKLKESGLRYEVFHDDDEIDNIIKEFRPDIWVNDCLNTDDTYIDHLKEMITRVITIEDLGSGTKKADAVINALYDKNLLSGPNVYSGWKYVCLRDEFQIQERSFFSEIVKNIIIMFGGSDPSNLNKPLYSVCKRLSQKHKDIHFYFIVGLGYNADEHGIIDSPDDRIHVLSNVKRVSKYMKIADLAVTSNGRTVFELASIGVPSIVLAQNDREITHNFACMEHGFLNLGLGINVDVDVLESTIEWLINTPKIRKDMYELMTRLPLREGLRVVDDIILGKARIFSG